MISLKLKLTSSTLWKHKLYFLEGSSVSKGSDCLPEGDKIASLICLGFLNSQDLPFEEADDESHQDHLIVKIKDFQFTFGTEMREDSIKSLFRTEVTACPIYSLQW